MMKYLKTKMIRNEMVPRDRGQLQPARIYVLGLLVESSQLLLTKNYVRDVRVGQSGW